MKFLEKKNNFLKILDNNNKIIKLKTPFMKCPFGLEYEYNKYLIKLEFTDLKNNLEMTELYNKFKSYFNEITEFETKKNLIDNIRTSSKYDPIMKFFLPFRYDKFEVDFYKNNELVTSKEICEKSYLSLEIEIPSLWYYKNNFGLNINIKKIYIK
jgi:hypothetical protein